MVCTMNLILFFILLTIFLKIFPTFLFINRVIYVRTYDKRKEGIDEVSKLLIKFMVVMVPIILIINLCTKNDWWSSLIFAITIAVGLTPEMLPVIMTSTMAKGAVDMSKKKTIVKRLSAIQTFGGLKNLIDVAIISRAEKEKLNILKEKYVAEDEIPFDFERRRMSVVLKDDNGKRQLITKGAVDEVMEICSFIDIDGKVLELTEELRKQAYSIYEKYNNEGLRVLAIAQKNDIHGIETFGIQDESDMVLIGFVGFLDPPKESAKEAISALKKHGVDTVVLTGDSEGVALNVCKQVGITAENRLISKTYG